VGEDERARAIYELAVGQPVLDMPEALWKAFIDFEIDSGEAANARMLYERLLERTQHVKVWMSYAGFETGVASDAGAARRVYERGYEHLKSIGEEGREHRALLVDAWRTFEQGLAEDDVLAGGDGSAYLPHVRAVEALLPRKVKKKRQLFGADGGVLGWEEYYDYLFPDDDVKPAHMKLLEMAQKWKAAGGSLGAALGGGVSLGGDTGAAAAEAGAEEGGDGAYNGEADIVDPNALDLGDDDGGQDVGGEADGGAGQSGVHARVPSAADDEAEDAAAAAAAFGRHYSGSAGVSEARSRAGVSASHYGLPATLPDQSSFAEAFAPGEDSEDEERGVKAEREVEDEARQASRAARDMPRDMYTEADPGASADRDP
jgi:hypothetical protein